MATPLYRSTYAAASQCFGASSAAGDVVSSGGQTIMFEVPSSHHPPISTAWRLTLFLLISSSHPPILHPLTTPPLPPPASLDPAYSPAAASKPPPVHQPDCSQPEARHYSSAHYHCLGRHQSLQVAYSAQAFCSAEPVASASRSWPHHWPSGLGVPHAVAAARGEAVQGLLPVLPPSDMLTAPSPRSRRE